MLFAKPIQRPVLLFLFFAFLAGAIISPIASESSIPNLADFINHLGLLIQAKLELANGQFPLRVASLWNYYATFQFYSPSVYTFAGLIYQWLTPANPLTAYFFTMWCGLMLGGIYFYRCTFWFTRNRYIALLTTVVYLFAPYYIIVVNHTGDLTETLALGIVPAALFYTMQRYYQPFNSKAFLCVGLSWYLLITTHVVTFVYTSFFIGMLLLIKTITNKRWGALVRVGMAYIFALLLAMWFVAPMSIFHKFFIMSQTYDNSSTLGSLHPLFSYLLSPGASTPGEDHSILFIHPSVGWPILFSAGLGLYAVMNRLKSGNRRLDYWLKPLLIIFALALLMAWSPLNFWQSLPLPLRVGQYTWRLLGQVTWIGALIFAWAICFLFKNKLDLKSLIVGIILIVTSANVWFPTVKDYKLDFKKFIEHPYLIYNDNSYLFDIEKYPKFVHDIDHITIDTNPVLQLDVGYKLSTPLVNIALFPAIALTGNAPKHTQGSLVASINDHQVAAITLHAGHFSWNIPLQKTDAKNKKIILKLQFLPKIKGEKIKIAVSNFVLTGFVDPGKTLPMSAVQPFCQPQKAGIICNLPVANQINLLELPMLYYPKLLKILVNGRAVDYKGILFHGYLMTEVTPEAGKVNIINVKFKGLEWANWISISAWFFALGLTLFFVSTALRNRLKRRFN